MQTMDFYVYTHVTESKLALLAARQANESETRC